MNIMITFWADKIPVEAIIVAIILLYAFLNAVTVRFFGISEFYRSIGKVLLMLMLFLFTFITMVGGNPLHDRYGFRYWNKPGAFIEYNASGDTGSFLGVLSCVHQASFSYVYTQIDITNIAFADIWKHHWARVYLNGSSRDGEPSQDPASRFQVLCLADSGLLRRQCSVHWYRHPIGQSHASGYPRRRDIRQRYWCSIVSTTPGNMSDCFSHRVRPYVIAMQRLQIGGLPHLVNALIMTSIFSAGNALLYAATRTLHGTSLEGHAPRIFSYCTKRGVPLWALCFSLSFCLLAFLQVRSSSAVVMGYLVVLITCCQMLNYGFTAFAYRHFYLALRKQGISRDTLPYKGRFQPYTSYVAMGGPLFMIFAGGCDVFLKGNWSVMWFFLDYGMIGFFVLAFVFWKLFFKSSYVRPGIADLSLGGLKDEIDKYEEMSVPLERGRVLGKMIGKIFE